jgi:hypothetical protein
LFFAIDSTSSMNDVPASGSTGNQSKWAALRSVWPQVISGLPASWAAGLMLWSCPNCPNAAYSPSTLVPIGPLDGTQVASLSNLPGNPPGGYTPTECAYNYALQQVTNWVAPPAYADSPRYIVLLTDGVPTVTNDCRTLGAVTAQPHAISQAQYDGLIQTVSNGTTRTGIKTFVAGVPGSDEPQGAPYDPMYELSLLAAAAQTTAAGCTPTPGTVNNNVGNYGSVNPRGTYCHYDLTAAADFATALRDALGSIASSLVSCNYPIPPPPAGYIMLSTTQVSVVYTSSTGQTPLTQAPGDDCTQGGDWYYATYSGTTPTQIDLCPNMCTTAQADINAAIDIEFTCLGE